MPGGKANILSNDGTPFTAANQPANRRKSTKFLTDLLTKNLKIKKEITIDGIDVTTGLQTKIKIAMPTKDVIVQALLRQAAKGNMIAINAVWDRIEGKAMQAVKLTGLNGKDLIEPVRPLSDMQFKELIQTLNAPPGTG